MFYYSHHIGDFIKDTSNLDDHHLATYLRMMWVYYTEEKPLSDDVDDIAFAVRSDEKTVRLLLRHFFQKVGNEWHHNRCDREIAEYHGKSEKARNSANARWKNAKAMQTHSERNANEPVFDANQEPITNNQEPSIKNKATKVACPSDVGLQEWTDWLALRKAKKAPVTETVVKSARKEAEKAGISLNAFLTIWCARGSQGLEASWLKSDEKQMQTETVYQKSMRLRVQEVAPDIARQEPYQDQVQFFRTIDITPQVQLIEEKK
jgi:uncharacterized protein YdaU (DUF1376 family)